MPRPKKLTVSLSPDEFEWLRRKAHWEGASMAEVVRERLRYLTAEEGYLRPPDDEPQDFGYEKEMMQYVLSVQNEHT